MTTTDFNACLRDMTRSDRFGADLPVKVHFEGGVHGHESVPFPAVVEAFIMLLFFEILREAGVRLPRPIGQAVSIVGALVIGEAAVSAGLIGAPMVIVVAVTAVSSFTVPAQMDSGTIIRFALLILAGFMGGVGVAVGLFAILIHMQIISLTIEPADAGKKVRGILKGRLGFSAHAIAGLTRTERGILVNGKRAFSTAVLQTGDVLTVDASDRRETRAQVRPGNWPLEIVWEDEWLMVVNKPAGMVSLASSFLPETPTVAGALAWKYGEEQPFHIVNRLDKGTTGLLIVAKCGYVHNLLREQSAAGVGAQEHLAHKIGHVLQERAAGGDEAVVGKARGEAHGLDLAQFPHDGFDGGAVQVVQPGGEGVHIRKTFRAPAQDAGDESVFRGVFPAQAGQQTDAQKAGFELFRVQTAQPYAGQYLVSDFLQRNHSYVFLRLNHTTHFLF